MKSLKMPKLKMPKIKMPKMKMPNLKNKDLMGCFLCMLIVVLVSQARIFNFFLHSDIGRLILLTLIGTVSYTDKIFGVASALFLVLAYSVHMNRREGFGTICQTCGKYGKQCKCSKGKCNKCQKGEEGCECGKKEGMCGKKKNEGFGLMGSNNKHDKERELQQGKVHFEEVALVGSKNAQPHESIATEFGSNY